MLNIQEIQNSHLSKILYESSYPKLASEICLSNIIIHKSYLIISLRIDNQDLPSIVFKFNSNQLEKLKNEEIFLPKSESYKLASLLVLLILACLVPSFAILDFKNFDCFKKAFLSSFIFYKNEIKKSIGEALSFFIIEKIYDDRNLELISYLVQQAKVDLNKMMPGTPLTAPEQLPTYYDLGFVSNFEFSASKKTTSSNLKEWLLNIFDFKYSKFFDPSWIEMISQSLNDNSDCIFLDANLKDSFFGSDKFFSCLKGYLKAHL